MLCHLDVGAKRFNAELENVTVRFLRMVELQCACDMRYWKPARAKTWFGRTEPCIEVGVSVDRRIADQARDRTTGTWCGSLGQSKQTGKLSEGSKCTAENVSSLYQSGFAHR